MILAEQQKRDALKIQLDKKRQRMRGFLEMKAEMAFRSGSIPPHFYEENDLLVNAVIDSFCLDRNFKPHERQQEHFDHIHRCS